MTATYIAREETAPNIWTLYFKPEKPVGYIAGQFTELYLPHPNQDKRGDKRWFTLSSAPSEELLSITTRFAGENGSSFKQALFRLTANAEVKMVSPMGDFVLPKDLSVPIIFVAGGIGCTPFHSIIAELQITQEKRDIKLLYTVRSKEDVAFPKTFAKLGANFTVTTHELTAETILELTKPSPEHYIYLSGPEPMIEQILKDLKNKGIRRKHIYTDFFPGYTSL